METEKDVYYSDEILEGIKFEVNGILVIGTKRTGQVAEAG